MKAVRQGSAILVSLLVMAGIVLLSLVLWRSAIFSFDTVMEKRRALQRHYYLQGMQEYGNWLVRHYGKEIKARLLVEKECSIMFPEWPIAKSEYSAKLTLKKNEGTSDIKAEGIVYKNGKLLGSIQWRISKEGGCLVAKDCISA